MRKLHFLGLFFVSVCLCLFYCSSAIAETDRNLSSNMALTADSDESFKVVGYVQLHNDLNELAGRLDKSRITHVNLAFIQPDADGQVELRDSGSVIDDGKLREIKAFVQKMHDKRIKVLVSIGGAYISEGNSPIKQNYLQLLQADKRESFVDAIIKSLDKMDLDGIDIDLEGKFLTELNQNNLFQPFIKLLRSKLPQKKLLTAALKKGYGGSSIDAATLNKFNWINIMAYDNTGNWEGSKIGPHSSVEQAKEELEYWSALLDKQKLVLGLPFYGVGFREKKRSRHYSYKEILSEFSDADEKDEAGDVIYYNGVPTVDEKVKLAKERGSGVMIWELSQDAPGEKSLLLAIYEQLKELGVRK